MLKISPRHSKTNILQQKCVNLTKEDLKPVLLKNKSMRLPPGTIDDKGVYRNYRIFIYKFKTTVPCSKASSDDFDFLLTDSKIDMPEIKITKNLTWAFYSLEKDINFDVKSQFESDNVLTLFALKLHQKSSVWLA